MLCSDTVCFYPGDLLPLDHEPLIDYLVDVVVSAEPPAEPAPLPHRFQEVGQLVRLVMPVHPLGDAGRGAVGEDAVHTPPGPLQVGFSLGVLRLAGHFFRPPGAVQHPEPGVHPPKRPVPPLEVRDGGIEDTVLNVVGGSAAHGEPGESTDVEDLPPHQVEDVGPHHMDAPAVPLLLGAGVEQGEVFMVAIHEQGGEGLGLQPVQLVSVRLFATPYATEVPGQDHAVIPVHPLQLGEVPCGEPLEIPVTITRYI